MFKEKKVAATLQEDLSLLRIRVDELESQVKLGKLEAAEIYDKTLRLMQRMAKRYEVDKKELVIEPDAETEVPGPLGSDQISQSILRRRSRGAVAK